jgi:thymidylate synthase ThyX
MQISANIIQHSKNQYTGKEIFTFELEYPRYIHSEFMTHRQVSKNSASSRAIPTKKMIETILEHNVHFSHYGRHQPGMQADFELNPEEITKVKTAWFSARDYCIKQAEEMVSIGAAKQVVNRVLEPFQTMKVVATATDWDNLLYLRCHKDAQPEFQILANLIKNAIENSQPLELMEGEWHVPYVERERDITGNMLYGKSGELTPEEAKMISASCCAQVSYRRNDDSLEKATQIYDRLISSKPAHSSPLEHQATPIAYNTDNFPENWQEGITHMDKRGKFHSGNFTDWIQFRQLIR